MFANWKPFLLVGVLYLGVSASNAMEQLTLSINDRPFYLEVPVSNKESTHGLMYRKSLPEGHGMLFLFDPKVEQARMWMKNTYLSLDMLFIDPNYTIACIIEHTIPLSLNLLSCDVPVIAVIELNAGEVKKFHLKKGMALSAMDTR